MAEKVLDVADKETLDLVYEKLSGTEASLIVKTIKSKQMGTVSIKAGASANITLNDIVPEKTIVLLDGNAWVSAGSSSMAYSAKLPYVNSLTATQLTISADTINTAQTGTISYQVIEFY